MTQRQGRWINDNHRRPPAALIARWPGVSHRARSANHSCPLNARTARQLSRQSTRWARATPLGSWLFWTPTTSGLQGSRYVLPHRHAATHRKRRLDLTLFDLLRSARGHRSFYRWASLTSTLSSRRGASGDSMQSVARCASWCPVARVFLHPASRPRPPSSKKRFDQKYRILRDHPMFRAWSDLEIREAVNSTHLRDFPPGTVITHGAPVYGEVRQVYILVHGQCRIVRKLSVVRSNGDLLTMAGPSTPSWLVKNLLVTSDKAGPGLVFAKETDRKAVLSDRRVLCLMLAEAMLQRVSRNRTAAPVSLNGRPPGSSEIKLGHVESTHIHFVASCTPPIQSGPTHTRRLALFLDADRRCNPPPDAFGDGRGDIRLLQPNPNVGKVSAADAETGTCPATPTSPISGHTPAGIATMQNPAGGLRS